MSKLKACVPINRTELDDLKLFRVALSELEHDARMRAFDDFRHDVVARRLEQLFRGPEYLAHQGVHDYPFLKWAAETASERHEAAFRVSEIFKAYKERNERRLNIAEEIGFTIYNSILSGELRGVHVSGGILEQVSSDAREYAVSGGKDLDTLRKIWNTYKGVVHFGMALSYLEDAPDKGLHPLQVAEKFRNALWQNCPKGTSVPYVQECDQIKFSYISMLEGPRFRNRGLPFFSG